MYDAAPRPMACRHWCKIRYMLPWESKLGWRVQTQQVACGGRMPPVWESIDAALCVCVCVYARIRLVRITDNILGVACVENATMQSHDPAAVQVGQRSYRVFLRCTRATSCMADQGGASTGSREMQTCPQQQCSTSCVQSNAVHSNEAMLSQSSQPRLCNLQTTLPISW